MKTYPPTRPKEEVLIFGIVFAIITAEYIKKEVNYMAKLLLPLLSISAKNKIGDVVFFRRMGQNVARIKVIPSNPRTMKQTLVRYNLTKLIAAWKGKYDATDAQYPAGYVVLKKIDTSTMPWNVTEIKFGILTEEEKMSWKYPWFFVGENQKRLYRNMDPVRIKQ